MLRENSNRMTSRGICLKRFGKSPASEFYTITQEGGGRRPATQEVKTTTLGKQGTKECVPRHKPASRAERCAGSQNESRERGNV